MEKELGLSIDRQRTCSFSEYRKILDAEPGLIRAGIETEDIYQSCISSHESLSGVNQVIGSYVLQAAANSLLHAAEEFAIPGHRLIGTLPTSYYPEDELKQRILLRDMLVLSGSTADKIYSGDHTFINDVGAEIESSLNDANRSGLGEPLNEYMFMAKYDLTPVHDKFSMSAEDFETPNGFIISTRQEEIQKHIPEIVKLQGEVFTAQAVQTGYFAGLSDEDTIDILQDPDFIPIIAIDKNTNEVAMCTLFAPDFTNFDTLPWVNPNEIGKHLLEGEVADCLTLPLVVISKTSGLGLLKYAVQMATHETVYRKKPDTVAVMYESNPLSVFITPRTIHGQIERAGGVCLSKYAEVYYFTQHS